jgi:hypothetical protein
MTLSSSICSLHWEQRFRTLLMAVAKIDSFQPVGKKKILLNVTKLKMHL